MPIDPNTYEDRQFRPTRRFILRDDHDQPYRSVTAGRNGGHRKNRIYGRLDCPTALRAIAAGGYVTQRVFFSDEPTAIAAGYRPCATCLPSDYQRWKDDK